MCRSDRCSRVIGGVPGDSTGSLGAPQGVRPRLVEPGVRQSSQSEGGQAAERAGHPHPVSLTGL